MRSVRKVRESLNMNNEQSTVLNLAEKGHNLFLTGNAGTGKTYTWCKIIKSHQINGRKVAITASTGKAASVLKEKLGTTWDTVTTIHRFSGILDGRYENTEIVKLVSESENYERQRMNIMNTETVIIDEISMLSSKTFSQLEFLFRNVKKIDKLFGGMQIIVAGDLRQLPPVPNMDFGDDGSFFIMARFIDAFHVVVLHTVHRQEDQDLINAINEIARGNISLETEQLLQRLKRPLPPGEEPTHLYALNFDVDIWNARRLCEMEGESSVYHATDEGDCSGLAGEKVLHVKVGCPVILIVNLSDQLVNGLTGKVTETRKDSVSVYFHAINQNVEIKQFSFNKYSARLRKDVGSRIQIPLKLSFAMTIHKCQGSTIERVDLNCKNLFQYGQLVVGLSRTRIKRGLRVTNFSKGLIKKPPQLIEDFLSKPPLLITDDLSCCINKSNFFSLSKDNEIHSSVVDQGCDELSSEDELEFLEDIDRLESQLSEVDSGDQYELPSHVDVNALLMNLKYANTETEQQTAENEAISYLQENLENTKKFSGYIWTTFWPLKEKLSKREDITNKSLTEFYKECNKVVTSEEYKLKVRYLFSQNPSSAQYNVIFKLMSAMRKTMLNLETESIRKEAEQKAKEEKGKTFNESVGGIGKIRYIAGWCIYKLKKSRKKKILNIMYNQSKVKEMENLIVEKNILEHLEASESDMETSCEKESLKEIERKQNIRKGLTNVTDKCSAFFQNLDSKIRSVQTNRNLDIHGTNFSTFLKSELNKDNELRLMWRNLFHNFDHTKGEIDFVKLQDNILEQIYTKYARMSIVQLRKDYLQEKQIKKREATRKQIKMRAEGKKVSTCNMASLISDKSKNKLASHKRLQSEIIHNESSLENVFKKQDLILLCKVYEVKNVKSSGSKKMIATMLKNAILQSEHMKNCRLLGEGGLQSMEIIQEVSASYESESVSEVPLSSIPSCSDSYPLSPSFSESNNTEKSTKRKKAVKGKGKGKKKKGKLKWPCGICLQDASINSVGCDRCDTWFHGDCLKIESLDDLDDEWFCQNCMEEMANENN